MPGDVILGKIDSDGGNTSEVLSGNVADTDADSRYLAAYISYSRLK